ncbi:uncharacterized protein KZ484_000665 [Pholidichthys leucotaenia]
MTSKQLKNQQRNTILDQEKPEPSQMKEREEMERPQIKEEHDELYMSQEGEQFLVKMEADTFMGSSVYGENKHIEAEPNSEQLLSCTCAATVTQDERGSWHVDSGSSKEEEPGSSKRRFRNSSSGDDSLMSHTRENETDVPYLHGCKVEEVLPVQWLFNQERNSSLDQEEHNATPVKEEEEKQLELKQETDTFVVIPSYEYSYYGETEPIGEQLLSCKSAETESHDQETA